MKAQNKLNMGRSPHFKSIDVLYAHFFDVMQNAAERRWHSPIGA